jgi:hypothetical protein
LRASFGVANTPPSAAQRHQAIAVAESLAGVSPVFPGASRRREPGLVRPLGTSQSGETVSKERLRFDTRQIEPQRKIALGNINKLTLTLKLIDVWFSDSVPKPLMVKDYLTFLWVGETSIRQTTYWNDGITKTAELRQMLARTVTLWGASECHRRCDESLIVGTAASVPQAILG